jgi:hypothetical protein
MTHAGMLDLTPDDFLIARLLNVPAKHASLTCPGVVMCDAATMTCPRCSMCGAPGTVLLGTTPDTGWMFDKINAFVPGTTLGTTDISCGDAMPTYNTTGTNTYTQAHKDCIKAFLNELAQTPAPPGGWPCTPMPMTPTGGTGGAGGAGAGGAGAGGAPMAGSGGT